MLTTLPPTRPGEASWEGGKRRNAGGIITGPTLSLCCCRQDEREGEGMQLRMPGMLGGLDPVGRGARLEAELGEAFGGTYLSEAPTGSAPPPPPPPPHPATGALWAQGPALRPETRLRKTAASDRTPLAWAGEEEKPRY